MPFSRRRFLLGAAALTSCRKPKAGRIEAYAFVATEEDRSLAVIDLMHFRLFRKIPLEAAPTSVIAWQRARRVFALTPQNGSIVEIDTGTLAVRAKLHAGGFPLAMRLAPDAKSLWVLRRDPPGLLQIALDRFQIAANIKLPAAPADFDLNATAAAISLTGARTIAVVGLAAGKVEHAIDNGAEPGVVRFRSDGKQLLAGNRNARTISIVDAIAGRLIVQLPVALQPERFCFKGDGGQLFVTGRGMDAVAIVNPYQTEVSETILAGRAPGSMAVSSSPELLFVANPRSGDMTVIDIESRRVLAQVPVGEEPGDILITDDSQYALVLNRKSGDVAVVRIPAIGARPWKSTPLFTVIPVGRKPVSAAIYSL